LLAASVGLVIVSYESSAVGWLAVVGLAGFLYWLFRQERAKTAFWGGFAFGFLTLGANIRWFLAARPEEWAGIGSESTAFFLKVFVWFGLAAILALGVALFSVAFVALRSRKWFDLAFIPSLWVLFEYARNWFFVFASWGDQSVLMPNWAFGALGYAFIGTPLAFLSRAVGLYGLSFVGAALAALASFAYLRYRFGERKAALWGAALLGGALALLFAVSFALKSAPLTRGPPIRVGLLQTEFAPPAFYTRSLAAMVAEDARSGKLAEPLDLAVFPEGSQLFVYAYTGLEREVLDRLFGGNGGALITSAARVADGGRFNQILYRDSNGATLAAQDKYFLIPTGEFMPWLLQWLLQGLGRQEDLRRFESLRAVTRGAAPEQTVALGGYRVGSVSCSGIISPEMYRGLVAGGANVLVNAASQGIFRGSPFFLSQAEIYARFQAVSLARPFLQSSQGGFAYIIGASGALIAKPASLESAVLYGSVEPVSTVTPFARFGHAPILLLSSAVVAAVLGLRMKIRFRT